MTGESVQEHRAAAPRSVAIAVLTISDTRDLETDTSGSLIVSLAEAAGHRVVDRAIVKDEPSVIRDQILIWKNVKELDAVIATGGTGISRRDQTFETLSSLLTKPLPGYGELFRMLSFQEIGAAAMLSRAVAGLIDSLVVFVTPGSKAAVELAMTRLILPELAHVVREANKT